VATLRQRRPGVWEIRVFTGRDAAGRPTQVSTTVRGTKREAQRLASLFESRPRAHAVGRSVADVLRAWQEANEAVWAETSRRDYASRAAKIETDPIAGIHVARLSVADVERWHARLRKAGVGEAAIHGRHSALRAALAQAVRWGWVGINVATHARLRHPKRAPRAAMRAEEVRAAIEALRQVDPLAGLALRLAAVAGLRRAELAALRWDDVDGHRLRVDSSAGVIRGGGEPVVQDIPTKTATARVVPLDERTLEEIARLRAVWEQVSPYLFSDTTGPANPARIGWWWKRARDLSGIDARWRLHDLRHWTATMAITSGHDVRTVAGRLGHANAAMTLRVYAHTVETADQALAVSLAGALDDGPGQN
jgi:integrase